MPHGQDPHEVIRRAARAAVLVAALAAAGGAGAVPVLRYETVLAGDPPLGRPSSVTLDRATGELCIVDDASRTLDVFDARGLHRFRTDRTSRLSMPRSACLDAEGGFVLTDSAPERGRTIRKLNFLGEPLAYEPERPRDDWSPVHLSIAADGNYLTVDMKGLLAKHDAATGALLWSRALEDPSWERADLVGRPVEAPDGRIYVPHAGVGHVLFVAPDGSASDWFGEKGTKRGELAFPAGVAFAPNGLILVVDRMKHAVLAYDSRHKFVTEFGRAGFAPGDFYFPQSVAADANGTVWVAEGFEGRVQVYHLGDSADEPLRAGPAGAGAH